VFNPRDFSSDFRHRRDRDYRRHNIEETLFTHDRFVSVLMISEVSRVPMPIYIYKVSYIQHEQLSTEKNNKPNYWIPSNPVGTVHTHAYTYGPY